MRARAKLQNSAKPSSYNSKNLAIERQRRRQQHRKGSNKRRQRWLDSVLLRSVARRRKRKLKRWLLNGRSNSCNATLQPQKNLATH
jgi:hypothetical protein